MRRQIIYVTSDPNWLKNIFCICKMYLISAEGSKNASVRFLRVRKTREIQMSMKNVHNRLGVQNMSDLILKEIYGIYETKNLTNKQIQKYKMTGRVIFEKYDNLSKDELDTKSNKNVCVRNDTMTYVIKRCRVEKKGERKKDGFKKLMISESEISECSKYEVKSKIGNIFANEKILEEYSVKIYEIDPYFYEHYKKKIQVDNNDQEYILLMKKVILTETLFLKKKDKRHQKKNLTVHLLELILVKKIIMQTMKLVECKRILVMLIKTK